jgi:hypothetical protein
MMLHSSLASITKISCESFFSNALMLNQYLLSFQHLPLPRTCYLSAPPFCVWPRLAIEHIVVADLRRRWARGAREDRSPRSQSPGLGARGLAFPCRPVSGQRRHLSPSAGQGTASPCSDEERGGGGQRLTCKDCRSTRSAATPGGDQPGGGRRGRTLNLFTRKSMTILGTMSV